MIEVPSLLYELDALLPRVDFVSVGSNDLLQYFFAADRNNTRVAGALRRPVGRAPAGARRPSSRPPGATTGRSACAARWPAGRSRPWR